MHLESVGTPVLWIGFVGSIPAIFAVTRDLFIVYTSNIFAIFGLKMLLAEVYKVPIGMSLGVIVALLAGSMIASLLLPPAEPPLPHPADDADPVPHSTEADR